MIESQDIGREWEEREREEQHSDKEAGVGDLWSIAKIIDKKKKRASVVQKEGNSSDGNVGTGDTVVVVANLTTRKMNFSDVAL